MMQLVLSSSTHLPPNHAVFWFLMKVGILIGLATTYPLN